MDLFLPRLHRVWMRYTRAGLHTAQPIYCQTGRKSASLMQLTKCTDVPDCVATSGVQPTFLDSDRFNFKCHGGQLAPNRCNHGGGTVWDVVVQPNPGPTPIYSVVKTTPICSVAKTNSNLQGGQDQPQSARWLRPTPICRVVKTYPQYERWSRRTSNLKGGQDLPQSAVWSRRTPNLQGGQDLRPTPMCRVVI